MGARPRQSRRRWLRGYPCMHHDRDLLEAMRAVFALAHPADMRPGVPDVRDARAGIVEAARVGLAAGKPPEWCAGAVRGFLTRGLPDSTSLWQLIDQVVAEVATQGAH